MAHDRKALRGPRWWPIRQWRNFAPSASSRTTPTTESATRSPLGDRKMSLTKVAKRARSGARQKAVPMTALVTSLAAPKSAWYGQMRPLTAQVRAATNLPLSSRQSVTRRFTPSQ